MLEAVEAFCCQALGVPRKDELNIESVRRVKSAPKGTAFLEVVVLFGDTFARDDILTRGPMLSEYRNEEGKPTAGIRLEIPSHLMGSFKSLEAFGFALRRRHGPSFKKHIKFDEFEESLYLQAGIKEEEDTPVDWTRYSATEAREGLKTLNAKKTPRIDLLKSPVQDDRPAETGTRKKTTINTSGKSSAFPWIPPSKSNPAAATTPAPTKTWEAPTRNMDTE